jgi:hypothetical protein
MATRRELIEAVGERCRRSDRSGKRQILDEFLKLTGYHRIGEPDHDVLTPSAANFRRVFVRSRDARRILARYQIQTEI